MQRDDRYPLTCPRRPGLGCPSAPCLGESDPGACHHLAALQQWRSRPFESQAAGFWAGDGLFVPSVEPGRGRVRVGLWAPCLGLGGAEAWQLAMTHSVDPDAVCWRGAAVIEGRNATDPRMVEAVEGSMPVGFGLDAARILASTCDVIVSWAVIDVAAVLRGLPDPPDVLMACHFPAEAPWGEGTSRLLESVTRFVAVSELAVEAVPTGLRDRVEVIWNAVDVDRLVVKRDRAAVRESWGVPLDAPVAGYLGRLSAEKDPDAMLRLAQELPADWHVVIVGEGRERSRLIGRRRVHVVGGDPAAGDVLGAFDSLVVPSRYESFGLTLAEGLWTGVPVVSTRSGLAKLVPGLVREVSIGASGRELARAVVADCDDPLGTRARVAEARSFARSRLGLDRFGRDWTELLVRTARERRGSACPASNRVA